MQFKLGLSSFSLRDYRKLSFLFLFICGLLSCNNTSSSSSEKENASSSEIKEEVPAGTDNLAYRWGEMALKATAFDTERFTPRPTITSRYLGLIFTAVFDAWSRYDDAAIPVYLEGVDRRPEAERTLKNKEKAISYAAFRTMYEYYYSDSLLFIDFMKNLGYDPEVSSLDASTPEGIGNLAAKMVIEARKGDGANQYGEEEGSNGEKYFDYTHYEPINSADKNVELIRWQPKYFSDGEGGYFAPKCLSPHWYKVEPISLKSSDQFRAIPPPELGSEQLLREVEEVVELQANLTPEEKALVEFMRDGPQSVQQAGHWLVFAQDVSERDEHTLDQDVKLYFYNQMVAMDAFIACWDSKIHYDYARPYALVHDYFAGKTITGWGGIGKGMIEMKGEEWRPYSPDEFLCPAFPSYVSGHSTVSGACAEALKLWTASDEFGVEVKRVPGILTEPHNLGDTVTLKFPTFSKASEMAGQSRVLGGYHIQADNVAGLEMGRKVAQEAFKFYKKHLGETAETSDYTN